MPGLEEKARKAGFKIYEKKVRYATLTGESVEETRVTGYMPGGRAKISYSERNGEGVFTITLTGERASRSIADKVESLGGSVDLEEGKRLYAVFRRVTRRRAGDLVEALFGPGTTRVAREAKRVGKE